MAEAFDPNKFYSYSYKWKNKKGVSVSSQLEVRASDSMIKYGSKYYKGLSAYQSRSTAVGGDSGKRIKAAESAAWTEMQGTYSTYKTAVASQQASQQAIAARKRSASIRAQMGQKASGLAERRQLKKPGAGKPKVRKGDKMGGVAALKKPIAGAAI